MTSPTSQPPPVDALTASWWDATREHRLLLQQCRECGGLQHHPRHVCTSCGGSDLGWAASDGAGAVDSYTVVHRAARPDVAVPYVVARVRLDDGPLMLTNLVGARDDVVAIGDRVVLRWRDLPDGRALPVFAPTGGPA